MHAYDALKMRHRIRLLSFVLALSGFSFHVGGAEAPAKIVFISGKPSHGPGAHEHRAGNLLLAKRLKEANLNLELVVLPEDGYPKGPAILKDAATIVVFCTGHQKHLLNPKLEEFDALMKKGTGVVMIHWATEAEIGMPGKKFLEWMGGFCDLNWSVNPHWKPAFNSFPDHPISRGLTPFGLDDEWYYHMRFVPEMKGVTPILSALPGPETLKRPDGARSGNPDVRKAVANGEKQHVAWAYDRPDGKGRGFGFTGAHNHKSWQDDNFRKVVLNAILWTAHVKVPENGVASPTPSDEELKQNLGDKETRKKRQAAASKPAPHVKYAEFETRLVEQGASRLFFEAQRKQQLVNLDSSKTLNLLVKTLGSISEESSQAGLLRGVISGLEGRRSVDKPEKWDAVSAQLANSSSGEVRGMAQQLDQIFGSEEAANRALTQVVDSDVPAEDRLSLLRSLVTQRNPKLSAVLPKLLDDSSVRIGAIRAYRTLDDESAPGMIFSRYSKWEPAAKRAAVETLATRREYATKLLAAIKDQRIPKEDIPAHVARPLSDMLGSAFTDVFGDLDELSKNKAELMAKYTQLLTPGNLAKADPAKGRLVFAASCAACHQLYGEGGVLGPDLTGSNRADLSYILLNMIEPSADIPEAYQLVTLHTKDGQVLGGMVKQEDDQRVILNMVGQSTTVLKSDIEKREVSPMSMMPEGLLNALQDEQVRDLVKYLGTTEQVELPK